MSSPAPRTLTRPARPDSAGSNALIEAHCATIAAAAEARRPLAISGGGTRPAPGRPQSGTPLEMAGLSGILRYDATEMIVTALAGTPLVTLEATLAEAGQVLGFEPPRYGAESTLGGAIATGASGPRRPYAGAARDFVLGTTIINGRGELLRFGGEVIKNVAGFDVSRLMVGACGTLGVLVDISLKVIPAPRQTMTLVQEVPLDAALARLRELAAQPEPVTGSCWDAGRLYLRIDGDGRALPEVAARLGGEALEQPEEFWSRLRDRARPFFTSGPGSLWRLVLPAHAELAPGAAPGLEGEWLIEWSGQQRWLRTPAPEQAVLDAASRAGGYAVRCEPGGREAGLAPVAAPLRRYHLALREAFDPAGILNPGRLDGAAAGPSTGGG